MTTNPHYGSDFDEFLREESILEDWKCYCLCHRDKVYRHEEPCCHICGHCGEHVLPGYRQIHFNKCEKAKAWRDKGGHTTIHLPVEGEIIADL